eukprot:jgi/Ulvmu1/6613/UM003_0250.1
MDCVLKLPMACPLLSAALSVAIMHAACCVLRAACCVLPSGVATLCRRNVQCAHKVVRNTNTACGPVMRCVHAGVVTRLDAISWHACAASHGMHASPGMRVLHSTLSNYGAELTLRSGRLRMRVGCSLSPESSTLVATAA